MATSFAQLWADTVNSYSDHPAALEFWLIQLVQVIAFWIPSTILLLLDILFPTWSNSHKIQAERFQPSTSQIKHCIQHVFTNSIASAAIVYALGWATNFQNPMYRISGTLPTKRELTIDLIYAMFAREILFYWSHRAFHHPKLYKRFHKQHHTFVAPMAFAAQYAHPLEHIVANILPIMLPMAVRKSHILTFCVYLTWALVETACAHSGYDFFTWPILGTMHDLHHEKFNVNFGGMAWLDWACGTGRWYRVPPGSGKMADGNPDVVVEEVNGGVIKPKSS